MPTTSTTRSTAKRPRACLTCGETNYLSHSRLETVLSYPVRDDRGRVLYDAKGREITTEKKNYGLGTWRCNNPLQCRGVKVGVRAA